MTPSRGLLISQPSARRFFPSQAYAFPVSASASEIEHPSTSQRFTMLACPRRSRCAGCGQLHYHTDCIVVGVYFGPASPGNVAAIVEAGSVQTAELEAGLRALRAVVALQEQGEKGEEGGWVDQVTLKTDSEYLVKGVTEWVYKWEKNGYMNGLGKRVVNSNLFKQLQAEVLKLTRLGVEVQFWLVKREDNAEAIRLVSEAVAKT
ncbi:hypothetical protein B2J93_3959 [Marssonina coronariae]|uniref:RNase H type-1 domain-containing protein n=1 Tax=Diplocarpon coronariae TaxID=2795749 RepID=A0A218YX35_9HELO|nr:hypothetical protein B2J93_3959 [Marssonina coronariae]